MSRRRLLIDKVLDDMAEHARTGEPLNDGARYTCGLCMREAGVTMFVVDVGDDAPDPGGVFEHDPRGRFQYRLVCPCCSLPGCTHRPAPALAAEAVGL
jgi:hypothetical protein